MLRILKLYIYLHNDMDLFNKIAELTRPQKPLHHRATELEFDNINHADYPDYCDAATIDGTKDATEDELDELNDNNQFRHESLEKYLH